MTYGADLERLAYIDAIFAYDGRLSEDHIEELEELFDRVSMTDLPAHVRCLWMERLISGQFTASGDGGRFSH